MPTLKWSDADEIGFELNEKFPDLDPLGVCFTDMHKMAVELPDFADDPNASSEGVLEAIQMAWLEYFRED
ncbi:MAG: Fe-S cluster assembly protein IscX [Phycisphaerae bacterium]|jgi:FeS assembly protein IscX|nr:Fe-S cluster assembly protein IscX [Phycisphaerae bacterium]